MSNNSTPKNKITFNRTTINKCIIGSLVAICSLAYCFSDSSWKYVFAVLFLMLNIFFSSLLAFQAPLKVNNKCVISLIQTLVMIVPILVFFRFALKIDLTFDIYAPPLAFVSLIIFATFWVLSSRTTTLKYLQIKTPLCNIISFLPFRFSSKHTASIHLLPLSNANEDLPKAEDELKELLLNIKSEQDITEITMTTYLDIASTVKRLDKNAELPWELKETSTKTIFPIFMYYCAFVYQKNISCTPSEKWLKVQETKYTLIFNPSKKRATKKTVTQEKENQRKIEIM